MKIDCTLRHNSKTYVKLTYYIDSEHGQYWSWVRNTELTYVRVRITLRLTSCLFCMYSAAMVTLN